jgi:hypothetical protein
LCPFGATFADPSTSKGGVARFRAYGGNRPPQPLGKEIQNGQDESATRRYPGLEVTRAREATI